MSLLPTTQYKLRILCKTFNHAHYVEDAMNGFCMQKTNFPYVVIIIDDASTDGTSEVIGKYLDNHFDMAEARHDENDDARVVAAIHQDNPHCHFLVFFLKYNFYQIGKVKYPLFKGWHENVPYVAFCEGDDYWMDSSKLQRQVDFLDTHTKYSMTCCRARMLSMKKNAFRPKDNYCRHGDGDLDVKDVIRRGGYYIPTCSYVYKGDLINKDYPDYCRKSPVGDYPLQIWCALKGNVFYFDDPMVVYRVDNPSAWSGRKDALKSYSEKDLDAFRRQVDMLKGFARDFPQYAKPCTRRAEFYINSKFRSCYAKDLENQKILDYFKEDIDQFCILSRIDKRMRLCGNKYLLTLYYGTVFKWLFRNYLDLFW